MQISKALKYLATFNKPSVFQSLKLYKNSAAQKHLHDYIRD